MSLSWKDKYPATYEYHPSETVRSLHGHYGFRKMADLGLLDTMQRRDGAVEIFCIHCKEVLWVVEDEDVPYYLNYISVARKSLEAKR
jgi:hypothetical protein